MSEPELNDRQQKFVAAVASGLSTQQAALKAGFSQSYARKSSRLLRHPTIASAVAAIREQGRTLAAFDLESALREADQAAKFARANKNSMANVKGTELKAKLAGHLIDRVEVVHADLKTALSRAEKRLIDITPCPHCGRRPGQPSDTTNGGAQLGTPIHGNTHGD